VRKTRLTDVMQSASLDDCIQQSHQLAAMVAREYRPDCVVAILDGGVLPAMIIAEELGLAHRLFGIRVKRRRDIEQAYRLLPAPVAGLVHAAYYVFSRPVVEKKGLEIVSSQALVVDDRADTESSLRAAVEHLDRHCGIRSVRTAVLSWLGKWPPKMPPNFHVHKGMLKLPWSARSAEENPDYHADFCKFIQRHVAYLVSRGIIIGKLADP